MTLRRPFSIIFRVLGNRHVLKVLEGFHDALAIKHHLRRPVDVPIVGGPDSDHQVSSLSSVHGCDIIDADLVTEYMDHYVAENEGRAVTRKPGTRAVCLMDDEWFQSDETPC